MWPEIERAHDENRKELVLSSAKVTHDISDGLDPAIYTLNALNYLEINGIAVNALSKDLGKLTNLTSLILKKIAIKGIPDTISKLVKLKILDLSFNNIEYLPESIGNLINLESLLLGSNALEDLPGGFGKLDRLHVINLSHNKLSNIEKICQKEFVHLHLLNLQGNSLVAIPTTIDKLSSLKTLDLSANQLEQVPGEMGQCGKLKEIELKGNKFKDNRFTKLVNQGKYKAILDYIRKNFPLSPTADGGDQKVAGVKGKKKKGKGAKKDEESDDGVEIVRDLVEVLHFNAQTPTVTLEDSVLEIRPHIVCCIMRNVDLSAQHRFKKFINLQTKLHDDLCEKRTVATIATHDLAKIKGNLSYQGRVPLEIQIQPLFKPQPIPADDLVARLRKEADDYRKEHKRNTFSGIHKYLELLDNADKYPCLVDVGNNNNIISFPPITNSDTTKVSGSSTDLLLEVTSNKSIHVAKHVMDRLLSRLMQIHVCRKNEENGGSSSSDAEDAGDGLMPGYLRIQQVMVLDSIGQMKLVYPSRTDLTAFTNARIKRDY